jgi:hypothetical protein
MIMHYLRFVLLVLVLISGSARCTASGPHDAVVASLKKTKLHRNRRRSGIPEMALALRWTGELNRRLQVGCNVTDSDDRLMILPHRQSAATTEYGSARDLLLRGGQTYCYRIASTAAVLPTQPLESSLTIFHAKIPRKQASGVSRRGAARWGPDMDTYLRALQGLLDIVPLDTSSSTASSRSRYDESSSSLELTLAMVYLDRACSVEIPRSNGFPPCPFLTPRTCHRLVLAAFLVTLQAVRGIRVRELYPKLAGLGIPQEQLQQMVDWMRGALGDPGLFVAPCQLTEFAAKCQSKFGGSGGLLPGDARNMVKRVQQAQRSPKLGASQEVVEPAASLSGNHRSPHGSRIHDDHRATAAVNALSTT